jgi:ATP-dependent Clp protease ATP-binding subunit ClpA
VTQANEQIDRIVREVVRRLNGAPPPSATNGGLVPPAPAEQLDLSERVVTLAVIDGRLAGLRRVRVRPEAVITPAVHEALRDAKIELERQCPAAITTTAARLTLAVVDTNYDVSPLARLVAAAGVDVQQLARTGLTQVSDELGLAVARSGSLGAMICRQPAAAACLLNRRRGVRAAEAHHLKAVEQALESLGANALVIDPVGKSTHEIKRMIELLCRDRKPCPAELKERLA